MNRLLMRVRKGPEANIRRTPQVGIPMNLLDYFTDDIVYSKKTGEAREIGKYMWHSAPSVPDYMVGKMHNVKIPCPEIRDLEEPVLLFEKTADRIFYDCYDGKDEIGKSHYQILCDGLNSGLTKTSIGNVDKATWWMFLDDPQPIINEPVYTQELVRRRKRVLSEQENDCYYHEKLEEVRQRHQVETAKLNNKKTNMKEGFVYVMSNPREIGRYKVGKAIDYEKRKDTLNTADSNRGFKVEFAFYTEKAGRLEKRVHLALDQYAVPNSDEWFEAPLDLIRVAIVETAKSFK